jgi:RNA polymerase sigma-70 factor (ECF subfamily)
MAAGDSIARAKAMTSSSERPRSTTDAEARLRRMVESDLELVWRVLRGLGVPAEAADDATQQVFWIASRKLDAIAVGSERSFLFATAKGVAANARRSVARNREHFDAEAIDATVDPAPDPEEVATTREAQRILERLLEAMPEDLRTVFVLFELEGMTAAAIAELLGIPPGTVASRLRRARELFDRQTSYLQAEREAGS